MSKITDRSKSNKLHLNIDKSNAILFQSYQKTINTYNNMIKINDITVPFSNSIKFVDNHICKILTWHAHIKHISIKSSKNIGILSHLRNELPSKMQLLIYNYLILPYPIYCCNIWGFTYQTHITKVFTIQKKALKIICNSPTYCHTMPIFKIFGILNIHQLIQYHGLIFIFERQNKMLSNVLRQKFNNTNIFHTYETQNNFKFNISENSIFNMGARL